MVILDEDDDGNEIETLGCVRCSDEADQDEDNDDDWDEDEGELTTPHSPNS